MMTTALVIMKKERGEESGGECCRKSVTEYQHPLWTHKWNKIIIVTVSPQMWSTPENWTRSHSQWMICPWLEKTTRRCQQKRNQTWNCSCQSVRLPWAMQSFLRSSSRNSCLFLMGWVVPGLGVFGCPLWSIASELCREGKCLGLCVWVCVCVCVCVCVRARACACEASTSVGGIVVHVKELHDFTSIFERAGCVLPPPGPMILEHWFASR